MKTYVKPSFEVVQLRPEEGIACDGSSAKYPKFNFGWWFSGSGNSFWKPSIPIDHRRRGH